MIPVSTIAFEEVEPNVVEGEDSVFTETGYNAEQFVRTQDKEKPDFTHVNLAEMILDESGYTTMWQNDKTPEAPGRLENLKELVKAAGAALKTSQGFPGACGADHGQ